MCLSVFGMKISMRLVLNAFKDNLFALELEADILQRRWKFVFITLTALIPSMGIRSDPVRNTTATGEIKISQRGRDIVNEIRLKLHT